MNPPALRQRDLARHACVDAEHSKTRNTIRLVFSTIRPVRYPYSPNGAAHNIARTHPAPKAIDKYDANAMLIEAIHIGLPAWVRDEVDAAQRYEDDDAKVALAIRLSLCNVERATGGPFGAAVFTAGGQLVSVGVNRVLPQNCSVAHAEMMAYMLAQSRVQRSRLNENGERFVLASSAQPCCQCYGATFWAGIDELLIGARSEDVEELTDFDEGPLPPDWIGELESRGITVRRDIMREAARDVFLRFGELGGKSY